MDVCGCVYRGFCGCVYRGFVDVYIRWCCIDVNSDNARHNCKAYPTRKEHLPVRRVVAREKPSVHSEDGVTTRLHINEAISISIDSKSLNGIVSRGNTPQKIWRLLFG